MTPQQAASAASYAEGLAHWRGREFDAAAQCFARFAHIDIPAALFLGRARAFVESSAGFRLGAGQCARCKIAAISDRRAWRRRVRINH